MHLAPELELKILSYIEPDPVVYTRLAMASKFYYSLFTSDEKWLSLDIEDKKTGLFQHYIGNADLERLKHCWSDFYECQNDLVQLYGGEDGHYLIPNDALDLLGLVRHHSYGWWTRMNLGNYPLITSPEYARVAIGIDHYTIHLVNTYSLELDPTLMDYCVSIDPTCLNWLDEHTLPMFKDLLLTELRKDEGFNLRTACFTLLNDEYDRDFLWEACEYQPHLFPVFDDEEGDPKIIIKVGFYHKLLDYYSREQLKDIFSRSVPELYSDLELFRRGISAAPQLLDMASESIRDDEETVLQVMEVEGNFPDRGSERLRADADLWAAAVNANWKCFEHVEEEMKESQKFKRQLTSQEFFDSMLDDLPSSYWDDEIVVRNALRCDSYNYRRASARVVRIRSLAIEAVQADPINFDYIDEDLRDDREIVLLAMKKNPTLYLQISEELKKDKDIVLAAAEWPVSFSVFSDELQHDKDVVLAMVNAVPISHCPNPPRRVDLPIEFCGDRDVALTMVRKFSAFYFYLTDGLRMDREVVLAAFDGASDTKDRDSDTKDREKLYCKLTCTARIAWVPEPLRYDLDIARAAITTGPCNYNDLPVEVRANRDLAVLALDCSSGEIPERQVDIAFLPPEFLEDEEVMTCSAKALGMRAYLLAPDHVKRQHDFLSALAVSGDAIPLEILKQFPPQVWADREVVLKAAKTTPDILELAPLFRDDKDVVMAVLSNPDADPRLDLFSERLASNKQIIFKAIDSNNAALEQKPRPGWLEGACEKLRATLAKLHNVDFDVIFKYLEPFFAITTDSSYRCNILPQLSSTLRDNRKIVEMCVLGGIYADELSSASARLLGDQKLLWKAICPTSNSERYWLQHVDIAEWLRTRSGENQLFNLPNLKSSLELADLFERYQRGGEFNLQDTIARIAENECELSELVSYSGKYLELASEKLRDDKNFALKALKGNRSGSEQLQFFSQRLRDDFDVVKLAFEKTVPRLELVSQDLRDNTELAIMAVKRDIEQRQYVSERVREKFEFIKMLIERSGSAFDPEWIPQRVYDNKHKMMRLIRGTNYRYTDILFESCSSRLRDDIDMVKEAKDTLMDTGPVREAKKPTRSQWIDRYKRVLRVAAAASPRLQASRDLVLLFTAILRADPYLIPHYLPESLRDNKAFMLQLVSLQPMLFRVASNRLRGDPGLLAWAMNKDPGAKLYALSRKRAAEEPEQEASKKRQRS